MHRTKAAGGRHAINSIVAIAPHIASALLLFCASTNKLKKKLNIAYGTAGQFSIALFDL
jgi:hypothetical protein